MVEGCGVEKGRKKVASIDYADEKCWSPAAMCLLLELCSEVKKAATHRTPVCAFQSVSARKPLQPESLWIFLCSHAGATLTHSHLSYTSLFPTSFALCCSALRCAVQFL